MSHRLSQQGSSSYFAIMTEPASDFKNECYHYSLQYSTKASLESNKEQNVYFKDLHFPLNAWIKLQTVVFWELSYVLTQRFWRSASCLEIGLWLAWEFSNAGFWFSATVAAARFCILAWGFFLSPERMMNTCLSSSKHTYFLFNKNNSQYHLGTGKHHYNTTNPRNVFFFIADSSY